jgi:hypothetical protein
MGNDAKMAELILYVSDRCQLDPGYGATKLNKILFYADFIYYATRGTSITDQEYMRLDNGPVPRRLVPIREGLIENFELIVRNQPYGTLQQKRPIALRDPDLSAFTGDEIAMVDSLITTFWGKTAKEVSDILHRFDGWKLAADRETIPFEAALISECEPDEDDYDYARQLGRELVTGV